MKTFKKKHYVLLPREQICMPYSAGALKNIMITLHKRKRMDPREGEGLFNWKGILAPEQMDVNWPGIHLGCKVEGDFE